MAFLVDDTIKFGIPLLAHAGESGGSLLAADGVINAGLLDQVIVCAYTFIARHLTNLAQRAALQWIRRYIGQFGGDSRYVTHRG